ncbi:hypothetical protein IPU75_05180 [Ochrobactrum sp. SD129]|nr:hypothetical protein [Ochrobactrum sp. SD129]
MSVDSENKQQLLNLRKEIDRIYQHLESHSTAEEYRRNAENHRENAKLIRQQIDEYRSELALNIRNINEETSRYVNIVSVIGYAGYFSTWGLTKDMLGEESTAFVGLCGILSVGLFVLWEMFNVMIRLKTVNSLGSIFREGVSIEHFNELAEDLKLEETRLILIYKPIHTVVFIISFVSAIAGGLVMAHKLFLAL